jgi:hypothetical protein
VLDGERVEAMAYEVIDKQPHELEPRPEYVDLMVSGAREHGLPDEWVERLEAQIPG